MLKLINIKNTYIYNVMHYSLKKQYFFGLHVKIYQFISLSTKYEIKILNKEIH